MYEIQVALVLFAAESRDLHQHKLEILEQRANLGILGCRGINEEPRGHQEVGRFSCEARISLAVRILGGKRDEEHRGLPEEAAGLIAVGVADGRRVGAWRQWLGGCYCGG